MADTRVTISTDPAATSSAAGMSTADISETGSTTTTGAGPSRTGSILRAGKDEAFTEAKAMVRDVADRQRARAASTVDNMAGALHRAARDLQSGNDTMGRYTEMAAERLDEMADYLRQARWDDVMQGAESFARRQPYWFVGGAMAAGFVLARFLKSSGETQRRLGGAEDTSRGLAASSGAGYGTGTEAGLYPPTTTSTASVGSSPVTGGATTTTTTTTTTGKEV